MSGVIVKKSERTGHRSAAHFPCPAARVLSKGDYMKKLLKATAMILGLVMLLGALPVSLVSAGSAATANKTYLKGDFNFDGTIDSKDWNYVYNIVKGNTAAPAAGSDTYKLVNIVGDKDGFTMEDVRRLARVANGKASSDTLFASTTEKNTYYVDYFNSLVNTIKTAEFKKDNDFSYFLRTITETKTENFKFAGLNENQLGDIKKMYDSEMDGINTEYSALREDSIISVSNTPCFNKNYVSALKPEDIASAKIEKGVVCNILKDGGYADSYTRESTSREYDVTRFNKDVRETVKVTIVLKQENKSGVEKLPTAENGGETALMRGYGNDIRDILTEYERHSTETETVESLMTMTMTMKCTNLTSDCTIVYYFDAKTLEPIAANYSTKIVSTQHVDIVVNLFPTTLNPSGIKITGQFDPTSSSTYDYYYFFSNAYPKA